MRVFGDEQYPCGPAGAVRVFGDEQDPCGQIVGGAVRVLVVDKTLAGAAG